MFIKSPSGRKRFNVLGALNAITPSINLSKNVHAVQLHISVRSEGSKYTAWTNLDKFLVPHEVITVTNETYINAESVCQLLRKLAHLGLNMPITLVLDNAKYQKCQPVLELAGTLGIELLYLPSYSPNLNLIERLWKLVKKRCLYSKYYPDFSQFKAAISTFIEQAHVKHFDELDSLLTLRFQTFNKAQIMNI